MLCTVNNLFDSLQLLGSNVGRSPSKATVSAQVNAPPTVAAPIVVLGGSQVTGKEVRLLAQGKDDKGESNLVYSWKVTEAPAGGTTSFTANNSNNAKATTLAFSKPGIYSVKVTLTDKGGLSASSTQRITVKQAASGVSVSTVDNQAVTATSPLNVTGARVQLKAQLLDQFGNPTPGQQKITWSVTSSPSGGAATLSTAGNLTTIAFNKAGAYKFKATSASGASLSFSINVAQTVTRINVTPGTASLTAASTRQFSAQAFDQFNAAFTTQPAFAWSASAGAIGGSGLFTAPSAAGPVNITAKLGSVTGTATVSVTTGSGLQNASLTSLVSTLYADGSLDRSDVIKILRSAGTDGLVDGTELSDLRYVVANAGTYKIEPHVQVLASNVVNANPANMFYQGIAAGNLAVGSAASLLTILVDKWFMGTDVPTLTSSSLTYRNAAGVLFNGTPSPNDQLQGMLGDCYFISTLGAIAGRNPTAISNMFIDNGDGSFTVRFYTGQYGAFYNSDGSLSDGFQSGSGTADYITVNRMLPSFSNGTFAYSNYGKQLGSATTPLWIALAEKAYAQWNATGKANRNGTNTYSGIEGGWMAAVNAQVLGRNATDYYLATANKQSLVNALAAGLAVTIGTKSSPTAGGLVGSHAYSVTGYDAGTDTFRLYNPWGTSQPGPLSWAALQANCTMFVTADAWSSTPMAKFAATTTSTAASVRTGWDGDAQAAPRVEPAFVSEPATAFTIDPTWSSTMFDDREFESDSPDGQRSADRWACDDHAKDRQTSDSLASDSLTCRWRAGDLPMPASQSSPEEGNSAHKRNLSPELVDQAIDDIEALLREALA